MGKYEERQRKWPEWFRDWQRRFYNSKDWQKLRESILLDRGMRSDFSGEIITGIAIVDHVEEITPENCDDPNITLNPDNLQLLSIEEHNKKTFGKLMKAQHLDLSDRVDSII